MTFTKFLPILFIILFSCSIFGQSVGINETNSNPHPSAMLDVESIKRGVLIPRMSTEDMNIISNPEESLLIYNTDEREIFIYSSGSWQALVSGAGGHWLNSQDGGIYYPNHVGIGNSDNLEGKLHIRNFSGDPSGDALKIFNDYSGLNTKYGINVNTSHSGSGTKYGINLYTASNATSPTYGLYSRINPVSTTGNAYAIYGKVDQTGTGEKWAGYFEGDTYVDQVLKVGDATGYETGKFRIMNDDLSTAAYISNEFAGSTQTNGLVVNVNGSGNTGNQYGVLSNVTPNNVANKSAVGVSTSMGFSGGANGKDIIGFQATLGTGILGNKYGVKIFAPGDSNWAGYFQGRGYFSEKTYVGGDLSGFIFGALNVRNDEDMATPAGLEIVSTYSNAVWGIINNFKASSGSNTNYAHFTSVSGGASNKQIFGQYIDMTPATGSEKIGYWTNSPGPTNWAAYLKGRTYVSESLHVGTTAGKAGYIVSVDGKMVCEEVRVEMSQDWPDYVFEDDYNLMPIEKLEQAIDEKGHLPGIPSAQEIESEGMELGDMQKRMMEKIEELALYIIQLNKENKQLKERLTSLENN